MLPQPVCAHCRCAAGSLPLRSGQRIRGDFDFPPPFGLLLFWYIRPPQVPSGLGTAQIRQKAGFGLRGCGSPSGCPHPSVRRRTLPITPSPTRESPGPPPGILAGYNRRVGYPTWGHHTSGRAKRRALFFATPQGFPLRGSSREAGDEV